MTERTDSLARPKALPAPSPQGEPAIRTRELGLGAPAQTTWRRYEAKYFVSEEKAIRLRSMCQAYLPLDPYSALTTDGQYPIHSIYLDSQDRRLLRATTDRAPTRAKLRVRSYRDRWTQGDGLPAFFEIKRKIDGVVFKSRARVQPEFVESVARGEVFDLSEIEATEHQVSDELIQFLDMRRAVRAAPVVGVHYMREAFQSESADRVRISFDRELHFGVLDSGSHSEVVEWNPVPLPWVIFEIKFTNTYPFWVAELIRGGEVSRRGVCKYVMCSEARDRQSSFECV